MDKKGQAAMEFLMTYGWAILVVLAAIGALAYFGVLSPDKFLPEKCTIAPGIDCAGFNVETNSIELSLRNGMGKHLLVKTIAIGDNCSKSFDPMLEFSNGDLIKMEIENCNNGAVGDRFREDILIRYVDKATEIEKLTNGDIVARILE